ncbi:helix-turn-helix transcriptional regulator [Treponema brennaborense]|uniref:Uncharacterized protein n=1 Tax=Treponema brennaborense (strain DSM 12168 / CIP 105900 / DD5/3) TaxID=906968 RepID=F4LJP5_TREBD|nr:helix-turn-helix transcriptional regulator [Treponema brennaborense]AEE17425.1 hypothetical protein Trebr_2010 [Treponema brennaborense DSM 12168]
MKRRKRADSSPFTCLTVCGFIALLTGTLLNICFGSSFTQSFIPYTETVTPCVNGFCTVLSLILIFKPNKRILLYVILVIQSVYNVCTGFDLLGLFLFAFLNLVLFCKGYFKTRAKLKTTLIGTGWILTLTTLIPFGIERFIFAVSTSIFMFAAYVYIYYLLSDKLSYLLPDVNVCKMKAACTLPEPGKILNLRALGLTERQRRCVEACLQDSISYKTLADTHYVSESTIKKDMTDICRLFGVKNREMLRFLLVQYKVDST